MFVQCLLSSRLPNDLGHIYVIIKGLGRKEERQEAKQYKTCITPFRSKMCSFMYLVI